MKSKQEYPNKVRTLKYSTTHGDTAMFLFTLECIVGRILTIYGTAIFYHHHRYVSICHATSPTEKSSGLKVHIGFQVMPLPNPGIHDLNLQ